MNPRSHIWMAVILVASLAGLPAQAQENGADLPCPAQAEPLTNPQDSLDLFNNGIALACQQDYEAAIAVYRQLIEQDPDFAAGFDVHSELGYALEQLGQVEAAIAAYRQAIALDADPQSRAYTALPALLEQQQQPAEVITLPPSGFTSNDLLQLADEQYQAGRWSEAIALYRASLDRDPNNWAVYLLLGEALTQNQEIDAAIATYEQLIELDQMGDYAAGAYNRLGEIYEQQEQWEQAIAYFQDAIALHPGYADAIRNLADALVAQGDWNGAIAVYQPYIDLYQTSDVYTDYGDFWAGHDDWENAIAAYQSAIQRDELFTPAYLGLGYALAQDQQLDAAIATYEQVLNLVPSPEAYDGLGLVLLQAGQKQAAVEAFQAGLALDPNNAELRSHLVQAETSP